MTVTIHFQHLDRAARSTYERFFFETICSMNIGTRSDFTVPLPQINGLYFTSVQDTVERLTDLSGRLSKFQWRNCIFAPITKSARPRDVYEEIFEELKCKVPSLFVRSYVYLIFIKLNSTENMSLDLGDLTQPAAVCPCVDDYQIYFWNTKYEVRRGGKKNLFGELGTSAAGITDIQVNSSQIPDNDGIEATPEKLFIVQNPAHELQRIQDANSDIIDAFRAFNNKLPLVDQTQLYLEQIAQELDKNANARILVEGPARSGKTVLAMSLLARYPKSKMLLMNWYFYSALIDAFQIWSTLSKDDIVQLFAMPKKTDDIVRLWRIKHSEFILYQTDTSVLYCK